jgi:hypothetical protein
MVLLSEDSSELVTVKMGTVPTLTSKSVAELAMGSAVGRVAVVAGVGEGAVTLSLADGAQTAMLRLVDGELTVVQQPVRPKL